jgi:phosphate starvation-inducible protein PhoH
MTESKVNLFKENLFEIQKPIAKFLQKNEVSIITAPPGCAKDFICMHTALQYMVSKEYDKIIIMKPIVEVGRSMGFMPGEAKDKTEAYRKSFDDIINSILGVSDSNRTKDLKKKITFEAINFIRGNTFKNSIVILSEAQNCTLHELISVVTRLDKTSKMFINGDLMQSDIGSSTGLKNLLTIVDRVDGIEAITLGDEFQTRNPMIVRLNKEYSKFRAQ